MLPLVVFIFFNGILITYGYIAFFKFDKFHKFLLEYYPIKAGLESKGYQAILKFSGLVSILSSVLYINLFK